MRRIRLAAVTVIAAAVAVTVIAVPVASAGDRKYDTRVTITKEHGFFVGEVISEVRKCERGRRVIVFKQRPGADRKIAGDQTGSGSDWVGHRTRSGRFYARVTRKERHRFVCRADRSPVIRGS